MNLKVSSVFWLVDVVVNSVADLGFFRGLREPLFDPFSPKTAWNEEILVQKGASFAVPWSATVTGSSPYGFKSDIHENKSPTKNERYDTFTTMTMMNEMLFTRT